jgi:hypothetical protein
MYRIMTACGFFDSVTVAWMHPKTNPSHTKYTQTLYLL